MARITSAKPQLLALKKQLNPSEARRGIARLQERIVELRAFDVSKMKVDEPPEISAMQIDIERTLARIFGADTALFRRLLERRSNSGHHLVLPTTIQTILIIKKEPKRKYLILS